MIGLKIMIIFICISVIAYVLIKLFGDWYISRLDNKVIDMYEKSATMSLQDIQIARRWLEDLPPQCNAVFISTAKELLKIRLERLR